MWVINAYRAGEQNQLRALAEALGWAWEEKQLVYRKYAPGINLFRGTGLRGIDRTRSSSLTPPWPDLILSAGMRNEPVCRWIRRQSGGRSRIVHLGRPWADPAKFDLVITTPQYRLPRRDNVVHNDLPLNRVNTRQLALAKQRWQSSLDDLPRPRIAVIAGGNSGPYTFGPRAARRLAQRAKQMADSSGGALMVTTSARTPPEAARELSALGNTPGRFYRWRPGDTANPYFGYLAMADVIIVTADSISMLSEACATGKPVLMFDLGSGRTSMRGTGVDNGPGDFRLSAVGYRALMRWGWKRLSRDITLVHRELVASCRTAWLEETPASLPNVPTGAENDLDRAVTRVRALFGPLSRAAKPR